MFQKFFILKADSGFLGGNPLKTEDRSLDIRIKENRYGFRQEDLLEIGKRANNPKRNFLFISRLLGKHIIVRADMVKATGILLASLKYTDLKNDGIVDYIKGKTDDITKELDQQTKKKHNVLVIGFAETATGLGMGAASAIRGCTYQTTTREPIAGLKNMLEFREEHSHAEEHKCFSLIDSDFSKYDEIILVDDEITTGRTMLNLISDMEKRYGVKKYSILTILDWRGKNDLLRYEEFIQKRNVDIQVHSVMSGSFESHDSTIYKRQEAELLPLLPGMPFMNAMKKVRLDSVDKYDHVTVGERYFRDSGRFGVRQKNIRALEKTCMEISKRLYRKYGKKVLVIGHGENIYIPSRVAAYMGADFKTTTRSPICPDGKTIKETACFFDRGTKYYFYNKTEIEKKYDRVILLTEQPLGVKLCENMEALSI